MNKYNTQKGQVIIINTLMFFALSVAIIFALTTPVVSSFNITSSFSKSKEAFLLANSATNEAFYKLTAGMNLSSSEIITLAQGEAIIGVADTMDGKVLSISSDVDTYQRNYEVQLRTGNGVSFNYGLQVGQGGFEISGGSGIIGNVYSNGDIVGSNGAFITGSAVSANISNPTAVISNTGVIDPLYSISFGGDSNSQDASQSFRVSSASSITSMRMLIKKSGSASMNNITVKITPDNNGKPSKTVLTQTTVAASTITQTYGYINVPFESEISITPNTTYWIVFDTGTVLGQQYMLGANDSVYLDGIPKIGSWSQSNGGTWNNTSSSTLDIYFDMYVGGDTGLIEGVTIGENGEGDAWAYEVNDSSVEGTTYCQIGTETCDTSREPPVEQAFPLSEGNMAEWKLEAESYGATTTQSFGSGNHYLGPIKINGDLSVGSGGVLNLEGIVYVTGNITVNGNGVVRVNPALSNRSIILMNDGVIKANGGGQFQGSGASGSYILLVTTSSCPDGVGCGNSSAVEVSGGTGAVVINAQNGTIEFGGGAQAKQATAHKISMTGGTTVTYESGLVNPVFTTGPGGAWTIRSWKEVE